MNFQTFLEYIYIAHTLPFNVWKYINFMHKYDRIGIFKNLEGGSWRLDINYTR